MRDFWKISLVLIVIIGILWAIISFFYIPKINYLSHIVQAQSEKQERLYIKNWLLDKYIHLYAASKDFETQIYLQNYSNYFTINGSYCDINNEFFKSIESELIKSHIMYKPKLSISSNNLQKVLAFTNKSSMYNTLWKRIHYDNMRDKICKVIFSDTSREYIELETQSYVYSDKEITELKNYKQVWEYAINLYEKTPLESVKNTQVLLSKISNELIYPWEYISVLDVLWNKNGSDLADSNILDKWQIIQWVGGWSCLASSIMYRTLLDSGIEVVSQKAHNIYYKNIYWIDEIGLDSTIFQDDDYRIDLLFKNNYSSPIIFIPKYEGNKIILEVYAEKKEYTTKLQSISLNNAEKIEWKYSVYNNEKKLISESILLSKYDAIDDY